MTITSSLALLLLAQAPPAAVIFASTAVAPAKSVAVKDADPLICERQTEPGSLLKKKKVCMRKSEWAERRRENRMLIERSQIQLPMKGE